jgi:hypothetical protein
MIASGLVHAGCRVYITARKKDACDAKAAEQSVALDDPARRATVAATVPLGRIRDPDDMAERRSIFPHVQAGTSPGP